MTSPATYFQDDAAKAAREAENPGAYFDNGANMAGSNAVSYTHLTLPTILLV